MHHSGRFYGKLFLSFHFSGFLFVLAFNFSPWVIRFALASSSFRVCLSSSINLRIASFSAFSCAISDTDCCDLYFNKLLLEECSNFSRMLVWRLLLFSSVSFSILLTCYFSCVTCSWSLLFVCGVYHLAASSLCSVSYWVMFVDLDVISLPHLCAVFLVGLCLLIWTLS